MSLNENKIKRYLGDKYAYLPIIVDKITDSTNTRAKVLGDSALCKRAVLIAEEQTKGRGRLGRSFVSNGGKGLYLSILLGDEMPASFATSLTTYMAVIASHAIDSLTGMNTEIKWVNDIYAGSKKLAGILTEGKASGKGETLAYAVIGIGINVLKQDFPEDVKLIATTIEDECAEVPDINRLAALVIEDFLDNLDKVGSREIADEYKSRSFLIGKKITVTKPTESYEALVTDITRKCELVLRLHSGQTEVLSTGEVSVKPV